MSRKLHQRGALVVGIDFSENMCEIAKRNAPDIDFRVDSCSDLTTIDNACMDIVISNYVLMDSPDLEAAILAFHRVLKPGGNAVIVFSHPCFPQGRARKKDDVLGTVEYSWEFSYFERHTCVDPPWRHFTSEFIWFHRPLSDYWKAYKQAGFNVVEFEEPRITEERYHLADTPTRLHASKTRPYSVAFKLEKELRDTPS